VTDSQQHYITPACHFRLKSQAEIETATCRLLNWSIRSHYVEISMAKLINLRAVRGQPKAKKQEGPSETEAENAVRTLIRWAGDDPDREGLKATPGRVVRAYQRVVLRL
jgi:hypothetical protein